MIGAQRQHDPMPGVRERHHGVEIAAARLLVMNRPRLLELVHDDDRRRSAGSGSRRRGGDELLPGSTAR